VCRTYICAFWTGTGLESTNGTPEGLAENLAKLKVTIYLLIQSVRSGRWHGLTAATSVLQKREFSGATWIDRVYSGTIRNFGRELGELKASMYLLIQKVPLAAIDVALSSLLARARGPFCCCHRLWLPEAACQATVFCRTSAWTVQQELPIMPLAPTARCCLHR
jgi:hypothetical protein